MCRVAWSRWVAALTVIVLAAALQTLTPTAPALASPSRPVAPAEDPGPQAPADQVAAMRQAHRSGQRVEIMSQRTETSQIFANPDGTLTQETTPRAARVHRSDGSWATVDTTLSHALDGAVVPASTAVGLRFSHGGDGPMATISKNGKSLSLAWPTTLPAPTLDGDTAVYPDVMPGIDLRLSAEVDGFSEVLVVKTRQAADNPDLTTLRMGVTGDGVDISVDDSGRLSAVDTDGTTVFGAPTPMMWDSSDPSTPTSDVAAHALRPGLAAAQKTMPTTLDAQGGLTLVPDPGMLSDPDTVYPVFVDPSVSTSIYSWTYVDSHFPNQEYMSDKGRSDAPAGMYQANNGSYYKQRSYIRFTFSTSISGKKVISAEFRAYSHYQWYKTATEEPVRAYSTSAPTTSTTWNNQPTKYHDLGQHYVKRGEWVGFDAKTAVQQAADNGWSRLAFRLFSGDEDNYKARETYSMSGSTQPKLAVTVDTKPNTPTGLKISPCYKACSSPAIVSSKYPTVSATVSDPDGGNLKNVKIEVWTSDGARKVTYTYQTLTNIKSGSSVSWTQPSPRNLTTPYKWHVAACDSYGWCSAWSAWSTFTVDTTDPSIPTVSSSDYPAFDAGQQGPWSGGVGVAGTFNLGPNASTGVAEYRWSLDQSPPGTVVKASNGSASISVIPKTDGMHRLFVQSVDTAGNRSEIAEYEFAVQPAPYTAGYWPLDDGQGTTAVDTSDAHHDLSMTGGVSWVPGHVGNGAVQLDGSTGYLSTDVSTVDTTKDFTVAAWVYLSADDGYKTAVSQDGTTSSAFYLQYRPTANGDCGCWAFIMRTGDGNIDDAPTVRAESTTDVPQLDEWTNLVGVYDAENQQLRLYVNGVLQQTVAFNEPFGSAGPTRVGRALTNGNPADFWPGRIDQVSIYQRVLSDTEIAQMANP